MFSTASKIHGLTCMVLKRCSSAPQVANSLKNQGKTTDDAIKELALILVGQENLEGVTASIPGNRDDIDRIIARKRNQNDFKVLVVQDASRFTRAGQGHGQKLLYELRAVDILVYFVTEELLIDNDMAEMYASFLFSAARHMVKQLAYNGLVGSTNSFLAGKSPHARRPPFGMDRMYTDNGIDRHIIRNLADGTQQMLHPTTLHVIRTFAKNEKKGIPNHYIKQKAEFIRLIIGDPILAAIVMLMFQLRYVDGWSYRQIARHLNDNNVPSALGKEWHVDSVKDVVLNPIYVGRAIRGRQAAGIYFITAEGQPKPSSVTLQDLANSTRVRCKLRPREEWLERVQPQLENFLPEPVREIARVQIEAYLESIADAKPKRPNRDRHRNHMFLLKGILFSKQGHHVMTGRVGGKKGFERRSYAVSRGMTVPKTNNVLRKRVPAKPLEDAVLAVVREVVCSIPDLKGVLKGLIVQNAKSMKADIGNPAAVLKEIQRKQKQLSLLTDDVQLEDDDVLTRKCDKIKADIRALKLRLQQMPKVQRPETADADAIATKFAKEILDSTDALGDPHNVQTRRLLELLISRMEVDLETMEVEIDFAFPSWFGNALRQGCQLGLDSLSASKQRIEAQPENSLKLADFRCELQKKPSCYDCKRRRAA